MKDNRFELGHRLGLTQSTPQRVLRVSDCVVCNRHPTIKVAVIEGSALNRRDRGQGRGLSSAIIILNERQRAAVRRRKGWDVGAASGKGGGAAR